MVQPLCFVSLLFVGLYIVVICCQLNGEQTGFELYSFNERDSCVCKLGVKSLQCAHLLSAVDLGVKRAEQFLLSWDEGKPL